MVAMHYIRRELLVLLAWIFVGYAHADSWMSTEGVMLNRMASALKAYPILHNGQHVMNWAQVREVYDLDAANKNLRGKPSYPLEDHYEFIVRPVRLLNDESSEVAMIRTVPLQKAEGQPQWRYLLGRAKDGNLTVTRRSEEEVRGMFQKAGVPLPIPKPGLPPVELEVMPKLDEPPPNAPAAANLTATPPSPVPKMALPRATPMASPQPATPVTQTPAATAEQHAPVWLWVVGIAALLALVALALKRRA